MYYLGFSSWRRPLILFLGFAFGIVSGLGFFMHSGIYRVDNLGTKLVQGDSDGWIPLGLSMLALLFALPFGIVAFKLLMRFVLNRRDRIEIGEQGINIGDYTIPWKDVISIGGRKRSFGNKIDLVVTEAAKGRAYPRVVALDDPMTPDEFREGMERIDEAIAAQHSHVHLGGMTAASEPYPIMLFNPKRKQGK